MAFNHSTGASTAAVIITLNGAPTNTAFLIAGGPEGKLRLNTDDGTTVNIELRGARPLAGAMTFTPASLTVNGTGVSASVKVNYSMLGGFSMRVKPEQRWAINAPVLRPTAAAVEHSPATRLSLRLHLLAAFPLLQVYFGCDGVMTPMLTEAPWSAFFDRLRGAILRRPRDRNRPLPERLHHPLPLVLHQLPLRLPARLYLCRVAQGTSRGQVE